MGTWQRFGAVTAVAAIVLGASGCGEGTTSAEAVKERPIRQVGDVYRNYIRDNGKPPASTKDFNRYAQMAPAGCQAVRDGSVEVFWGVGLTDLSDAPSKDSPDEVLAYEKEVPTGGGLVLMKDRSVRSMSADEFKAAPKAGKTSSAADRAARKK